MNIIEHIGDAEYPFATVIYKPHPAHTASMNFFVAEINGWNDDGYLYTAKGAVSSAEHTRNPAEARRFFEGSVKWDGCSHIEFGDESGYLHMCGKLYFTKLAYALKAVYNRCGQLMAERGAYLIDSEFPL